jgi:hypothetical protein
VLAGAKALQEARVRRPPAASACPTRAAFSCQARPPRDRPVPAPWALPPTRPLQGRRTADKLDDQGLRKLGRIVIRTKFFDDAILTALGSKQNELYGPLERGEGAPACAQVGRPAGRRLAGWLAGRVCCCGAPTLLKARRSSPRSVRATPCAARRSAQVVLLGAGMDSRPWRLALPPGVAWFEVDRQDVLHAKAGTLQQHGAQVDGGQQVRRPRCLPCWRVGLGAEPLAAAAR